MLLPSLLPSLLPNARWSLHPSATALAISRCLAVFSPMLARSARILRPTAALRSFDVGLPHRREMSDVADPRFAAPIATEGSQATPAVGRFGATLEVIVSKIFPAGFGWQASSLVAASQGFEADSLGFALSTGAGDFSGVLLGHSTLAISKVMAGSSNLRRDVVTGLWLASAAFCSGAAWQPVVNALHNQMHCSFATTAVGCGTITGVCFYAGLRLGRVAFKPLGLRGLDSANMRADAMLSVSIGAATGTFVGTDISFSDNMLGPLFGVTATMSDVEGCVRAGLSTSTGFLCMQTLQNVALPRGANWLDPVKS